MKTLGLNFDLPIGFKINGEYVREVSLLEANSIAEEVYTRKLSQQPFTWIANVITIAVGSIGKISIGESARDEYFKTSKVTIPKTVRDIPWADANTLLLEIHRRTWEEEVKAVETVCRFCTKSIEVDINLNKIELTEEHQVLLEMNPEFNGISVDLQEFKLTKILNKLKNEELSLLADTKFNRMVFRVPTIGDALNNERYFDKNIELWRRVGADCLVAIQKVSKGDGDSEVIDAEITGSHLRFMAIKVYSELLSKNLKKIRHALREDLPVIPFAYMDTCACDLNRQIPHALDSSGFFSE